MLKEANRCEKILDTLFKDDKELSGIISKKLPIVIHNLRGYDSHLIMEELGDFVKNNPYYNKKGELCEMNIVVIPNNMEKYW